MNAADVKAKLDAGEGLWNVAREYRAASGCGLREAADFVNAVMNGHKAESIAAAEQNAHRTYKIDCRTDKAPCSMEHDEAVAWSQGAEHGALEMKAAILLWLKGRNMFQLAAELEQRIVIKD